MIAYVPPACTVPRNDFRSRRRESLIAPVPAVFELRSDRQDYGQGQPERFPAGPDIDHMQREAAISRLQFDAVFQAALRDIDQADSTDFSGEVCL